MGDKAVDHDSLPRRDFRLIWTLRTLTTVLTLS